MATKQPRLLALLVVALTLLAACNGPAKTPDAGVAITSPADGATITGDRSITVTATLTDAAADATITAQVNGVDATATRVGTTVTFPATLQDNTNTLTVSVQNPG
ncbi:MAG: Ig-like domain-containing protein, partial [Trueperaceae bacterium]